MRSRYANWKPNPKHKALSSAYQVPVDGFEECMSGDVRKRGVRMATEPIGRILAQEAAQHLTGLNAQRTRYANGALENHLEQVVFGVLAVAERDARTIVMELMWIAVDFNERT